MRPLRPRRPPAARAPAPARAARVTCALCLLARALPADAAYAKQSPLFPVQLEDDLVESVKDATARKGLSVLLEKGKKGPRAQSLAVKAGLDLPQAIAWSTMEDDLQSTGWIQLKVTTTADEDISNEVKMYAAGFLEGLLTAPRTSQFYSNLYQTLVRDQTVKGALGNVQRGLMGELERAEQESGFRSGAEEPRDPYWKHVRYMLAQLWGLRDGYNRAAAGKGGAGPLPRLELSDLLLINSHARLPGLLEARMPRAAAGASFLERKGDGDREWERLLSRTGHCSALVRLAPGGGRLLVGHSTWDDYNKMTRVFKYYDFRLPGAWASSKTVGFSSYPGCISSTDSFYMLEAGLVVMDTSLEVLNPNAAGRGLLLGGGPGPQIPEFMHLMAVNRLAKTGLHWTSLFSNRNGGAGGASQWLVVDFNRFRPDEPLRDNALRLVEHVPGLVTKQADMTTELQSAGFWASYNRPYFPEVRFLTGHKAAEKAYGPLYSFWHGPRAEIFARLAPMVKDAAGMESLMNRNAYPLEDVSPNEPGHAVSARMDLYMADMAEGGLRLPNGGIDAKVTDDQQMRQGLGCRAISGPSHESQPVFRWQDRGRETFMGWPHAGLPDVWNFSWVAMSGNASAPAAKEALL